MDISKLDMTNPDASPALDEETCPEAARNMSLCMWHWDKCVYVGNKIPSDVFGTHIVDFSHCAHEFMC